MVMSYLKEREMNAVSNELAQMAKRLNHSTLWRNGSPLCIERLIAQDCNSSTSN
ncbi:hypothetical protein BAE44_0020166 [Dichanthelium oligosanthes]|uniref:Uncharacterized protein n=1 Tax=Dichanthelium oligosanthes TaxID=888268 RepID=A0A1E5V1C3_9POAL|nr:hypothetical protein BAE44_0020166 [Dichanthelium oligosanthes]